MSTRTISLTGRPPVRINEGLWPEVAAISTKMTGWTWRQFLDEAKVKGRPAALIVLSDLLPKNYGFTGPQSWHAIGGLHTEAASWWAANPLAGPHSWPDKIEQPELRSAVEAYRGGVYGVLLPTAAEALKLHPLYQPPGYSQEQIDLALATGRIKGRDELTTELAEGRWAIQASGPVTLLRP